MNAVILLALAVCVFVPMRYVYPSRSAALQGLTLALGAMWGALLLALVWRLPDVSRIVWLVSLVFPIYYLVLSIWLEARRRLV